MIRTLSVSAIALSAVLGGTTASFPQELGRPTLNFYGVSGVIDMPSAAVQPDGQLASTLSYFGGISRGSLSFQIFPRVSGTFRYQGFQDLNYAGYEDYYDRSFDISMLILKESRYLPAVAVGLQDFVGTGVSSGEYIAASKTVTPRLRATVGLGWGRLGSDGDLGSPFGDRDPIEVDQGGTLNAEQYFRGPAAPFAGIEYQATDRMTLLAEYSSDAYELEAGERGSVSDAIIDRASPLNFGVDYRLNKNASLGAYYMYGSEIGLKVNFVANPYEPPMTGSYAPGPLPVQPRPARGSDPAAYATDWTQTPGVAATLTQRLAADFDEQGLDLESLAVDAGTATVRVRNPRFDAEAQAIGRAARAMSRVLPASVETFRITPSVDGMPVSTVTLRRSDLETYETAPDGADKLAAVAGIGEAVPQPAGSVRNAEVVPRFKWNLGPYIRNSYFDPDSPIRADLGARLSASYEAAPGLVFAGSISKRLIGNLDENKRIDTSVLPPVRSNFPLYDREGDPSLDSLTATYYFRPATNFYGRVTGGYLERMFGGVSGEILWKPVDSQLALGAELNYAKQRDYDVQFGFQDYDVVTGHLSAYYDIGGGYHAQVDVGRYLAGDYGATFGFDREFENGWSVGAFATVTDVSAEDFGEGSFDKGIRLRIPTSWFTGEPTRRAASTVIRPVTRDGGARLSVPGRLYGRARTYHESELEGQWGRVLR
ncbi:YjbH domain-containing protein [Mesobaculum littorinae]|uniref:YjbH domain-containing protein n=1 Tax=Mesobaculum littorinae TaxID=2486419 RepID=UPI001F455E38|nr:YjbH domain-containing protein [Mesobaculum littorinae]